MNSIQHNDPELENLLIILAEHPDEKENLIPRILKKLPWGCHPILYIEKIKDPQNRILIRDSITFELQIEKIKDDLVHLLPEYKSPDFLLKASFLMSYLSGEDPAVYDEFEEFLNTLSSDFKERLD
ncbi:MAG: hypothetical protein OEZ34_09700, partial [Spirochaetia bacterium]|nr:hypothetical protein [Spirochaetia bacterium]